MKSKRVFRLVSHAPKQLAKLTHTTLHRRKNKPNIYTFSHTSNKDKVNNHHIQKEFRYDGKISTLLKNLNEADVAFSFNVKYNGQKQGKEMPINGTATELDMYNDSGEHVVPVGSVLYKDARATWHIKK